MDVLVVRAGALGDVLLLRRAVAALRRADHSVHLLAPSAAGRVLFDRSRQRRTSRNDADRLRKYLVRFGLDFRSIQESS